MIPPDCLVNTFYAHTPAAVVVVAVLPLIVPLLMVNVSPDTTPILMPEQRYGNVPYRRWDAE